MSLVQLQRVDFSIGGPLLLELVDLSIEANERVCIVGRNGEGKSTLLKLISGELRADDGEVRVQNGVVIARLPQEVPQDTAGSVFEVVAEGLGDLGRLLARYHHSLAIADLDALGEAQTKIEAQHGWDLDRRVEEVLTRLGLPGDTDFSALSGGMKRRVLLAQALVRKPDILLLDEPTNHLDIEAIGWLETLLKQFAGSIVFITHDRSFVRALATRIVEIDRGALTDCLATTTTTCAVARNACTRRSWPTHCSTRNWPGKKHGFARASRRGARATKVGYAHCVEFHPKLSHVPG